MTRGLSGALSAVFGLGLLGAWALSGLPQAMAPFHVRDSQGRLFSGAAAFSQMWRLFPGWRWLGWLSAWPPLSWLFEAAYRLFLPLRPTLQKWVRRGLGEEKS